MVVFIKILSFVRSGFVALNDGYSSNAGRDGYYRSRTVSSDNGYAYFFVFNSGGVGASYGTYRSSGFSLRCLQE